MGRVPTAASTVLFLHGLGAGPASWDPQLAALPEPLVGIAPDIPGLDEAATPGASTIEDAAAALVRMLDDRGIERVHACGLSLGAMTATQLALDAPERVASLVLSGSQIRPNPVMMAIQRTIVRALPERVATGLGMTKAQWLGALAVVAATDVRDRIGAIGVPTLVLCGRRDVANLPAARAIAEAIPGASLQVIPGAGHPWNEQQPERFSSTLATFYGDLAR